MLSKGWSVLQAAVATATTDAAVDAAIVAINAADAEALSDSSKPYQGSLLHLAVYSGSAKLLKHLLALPAKAEAKAGAAAGAAAGGSDAAGGRALPPNRADCFKRTPLSYAACADHTELADVLIDFGADVNTQARCNHHV